VLAYVALVLLLRISGKRTLTKLNAFDDLVITVALGSTLSAILLNKTISLSEGVVAFGLLILLQFAITWLAVRWPPFEAVIKSEPSLLLHRGQYLDRAMHTQRITRAEILSAIRAKGAAQIDEIAAVILETDGSLSVVRDAPDTAETLKRMRSDSHILNGGQLQAAELKATRGTRQQGMTWPTRALQRRRTCQHASENDGDHHDQSSRDCHRTRTFTLRSFLHNLPPPLRSRPALRLKRPRRRITVQCLRKPR